MPELIFGNLLTSDNYDDDEKKMTGGRNGYGAKLTNIFSEEFIVETADARAGKRYRQAFESNMTVKREPELEDYDGDDFTRITFRPDLGKFAMEALDDDIVSLMTKRIIVIIMIIIILMIIMIMIMIVTTTTTTTNNNDNNNNKQTKQT